MALKKKVAWQALILLEATINLALTALLAPVSLGEYGLYAGVMWGVLPAIGAATAYMAVRKGLNNYVSWFIPPVCETAAHWLVIGFPPSSAGMALLNAGLCLIASATAQVKNERENKR